MRDPRILVWHWKQFDLLAPLRELQKKYGTLISLEGLVTVDSAAIPAERQKSFLGCPRVSEKRFAFYQECIDNLRNQYADAKLQLHITPLATQEFLKDFAVRAEIIEVWYQPQSGSEEEAFLNDLKREIPENIDLIPLPANTLIQEDELPFDSMAMPKTFSSFRKKIEKRPYKKYRFSNYPLDWNGKFSPARSRIKQYIFEEKHIVHYKKTRNGLGPGDYSSRLSKWLAAGTIRAEEVGSAILVFEKQVCKNESTYWLLFELLWRDFFHFLHKKIGNLLFVPKGMKRLRSPGLDDSILWRFHNSNAQMHFTRDVEHIILSYWTGFRRWALGRTGNDFIDAIMQELYFTGEISNRARQCAASFLIHDLHIPWWWGAQWFESHLLDYDVSSNWGNWAYIAGVGADARPVRKFNIAKQASTYDSNKNYREWVFSQNWHIPENALPPRFPGMFN